MLLKGRHAKIISLATKKEAQVKKKIKKKMVRIAMLDKKKKTRKIVKYLTYSEGEVF